MQDHIIDNFMTYSGWPSSTVEQMIGPDSIFPTQSYTEALEPSRYIHDTGRFQEFGASECRVYIIGLDCSLVGGLLSSAVT